MLARNPHLPSTFGNQVDDKLTTGGFNTTHHMGSFVFMSLESNSFLQAKFGRPEAQWCSCGTTHSAIIDSEIRFLAGPTTDVESIAALLSLPIASLSRREYTVDCTATLNSAYTVGGVNYELIEKDLAISFSSGASVSGLTAIDVPAIRGMSWILVDVFMRKYRLKFDVKECMRHFSRCGGQQAVECGDDPPGGLSTLSAHQMAHGGVVPHSSSSELSAHQMPARDDLCENCKDDACLGQSPGKDECEAT